MCRLEAATSRLEDIATSTELPKDVPALKETVLSPPPTSATSPPQPASQPAAPPTPAEQIPESIEDFDNFLNTTLDKYVKFSTELGGTVAEQVRSNTT
jgi:adenylyl cyclase-associated protein